MSIAVLNQVYDEMRRLAVAGSAVAPGDFRLKKLVPPLEQAGAKAPVFAKVAENVKALIDSTEATSAEALLELTSLVNAVLYTQGETGLPGKLEPITTTDLGIAATQTSARVLKPLLEALSSTGSGRLELIKDALERGAFRDLRLVKPSLAALDDGYGEIADLIAEKVLPLYGMAILPELRAKFDLKGKAGHARRLRLMHKLDPAGTREFVEKALEEGSKEVKVAATECLGAKDLPLLMEMAKAKAQEVRGAAYKALAQIDKPEAIAAVINGIDDKYPGFAVTAIMPSAVPALIAALRSAVEATFHNYLSIYDKKKIEEDYPRLDWMLRGLQDRHDDKTEKLVTTLFDKIGELKLREPSGTIASRIVHLMSDGTDSMQKRLAESHNTLENTALQYAMEAAMRQWHPKKVYDEYSPYFNETMPGKTKKQLSEAREVIAQGIERQHARNQGRLDPRWREVAIKYEHVQILAIACTPGDHIAHAWLDDQLAKATKTNAPNILDAMLKLQSPNALSGFFTALSRLAKSANYYDGYNLLRVIPRMPNSAIPQLEANIDQVPEKLKDQYLKHIEALRSSE